MANFKERRHLERFSIPGAKTLYKVDKRINLFNRYLGPTNLKDITKNGVCIEILEEIKPGSLLNLKILVPGEEKLDLRGQLVWSEKIEAHRPVKAGIQFLPYGKGKPYNSFKTRETLERLTRLYLNTQ
jgi:hypothetical protein